MGRISAIVFLLICFLVSVAGADFVGQVVSKSDSSGLTTPRKVKRSAAMETSDLGLDLRPGSHASDPRQRQIQAYSGRCFLSRWN